MALKKLGLVATASLVTTAYLLQSRSETAWRYVNMPIIRLLDAERAHRLSVKLAAFGFVPKFKTENDDKSVLKTELFGLKFDSPVGLAAGFDKHGECIDGMLKMGFSFVEVGSITPKPQDGNPKPRVFRLMQDGAIINRYGFNSHGLQSAYENISSYRETSSSKNLNRILSINLGKNKQTKDDVGDYVQGVLKLGELADMLVINISSPNTPGLRKLQGRTQLELLIAKVLEARNSLEKRPALLVKIAPDLSKEDKVDIASVVVCPKTKIDGLIVTNTTVARPDALQSPNKTQSGGLSGRPLKDISTECIKDMYGLTNGELPIIGVGGVANGEDAYEKICSGASLVQLYTALALQGPPVVGRVKRELAELLRNDGFESVTDAVGCDVIQFQCTEEKPVHRYYFLTPEETSSST